MPTYTEFIQSVRDIEGRLNARGANIVTITSFMKTSADINIQHIIANQDSLAILIPGTPLQLRIPGTPKNSRRTQRSFYNSVSVYFCIGTKRKICAKLFRTGFHLTGCRSYDECLYAVDVFTEAIAKIHNANYFIKDATVQMMNAVANMGRVLNLEDLYVRYSANPTLRCLYDRESYSGLRVKSADKSTVIFFPSGKTIIAGIRVADSVDQIYRQILGELAA